MRSKNVRVCAFRFHYQHHHFHSIQTESPPKYMSKREKRNKTKYFVTNSSNIRLHISIAITSNQHRYCKYFVINWQQFLLFPAFDVFRFYAKQFEKCRDDSILSS